MHVIQLSMLKQLKDLWKYETRFGTTVKSSKYALLK